MGRWLPGAAALVVLAASGVSAVRATTQSTNWTGYLHARAHNSYSPDRTITPANAASLTRRWTFVPEAGPAGAPGNQFLASPTVSNGVVYIGANTGDFYAIDLGTGTKLWKRDIGFQPGLTCNQRGITSTATVANDPNTGKPTVYVAGGNGYLYALNAATGANVWRALVGPKAPSTKVNDVYNWASPIVFDGSVYMGISSNCDSPWVRGGLEKYSQETGASQGTWWAVPRGSLGGGVWTSPTANATTMYVSTASATRKTPGDTFSVVSINPKTMATVQRWQVPLAARAVDSDWGSSPTLFSAGFRGTRVPLVAACNKNGYLYAFRTAQINAGPIWKTNISAPNSNGNRACLPRRSTTAHASTRPGRSRPSAPRSTTAPCGSSAHPTGSRSGRPDCPHRRSGARRWTPAA